MSYLYTYMTVVPLLGHFHACTTVRFFKFYYYYYFFTTKVFFSVLCKELELASSCSVHRIASRSVFSSLINSLAASHISAVCWLRCSFAPFLLLSRCLVLPTARFWKGGNEAVRTHIPYSPTPVRSAISRIYSVAGLFFSLFFRGPSEQHTSISTRSRVLLLLS